jgi:Lsr2
MHPRDSCPPSFSGVSHLTAGYATLFISVMAKSVSVIVTDDLDGSENAERVSFSLDGVSYEIDLATKNRAKLEKALAPFIEAGRKVPRSGRRRGPVHANGSSADRGAAVRAWAKASGLKVSERGRVSADIMRQYEAAH